MTFTIPRPILHTSRELDVKNTVSLKLPFPQVTPGPDVACTNSAKIFHCS